MHTVIKFCTITICNIIYQRNWSTFRHASSEIYFFNYTVCYSIYFFTNIFAKIFFYKIFYFTMKCNWQFIKFQIRRLLGWRLVKCWVCPIRWQSVLWLRRRRRCYIVCLHDQSYFDFATIFVSFIFAFDVACHMYNCAKFIEVNTYEYLYFSL